MKLFGLVVFATFVGSSAAVVLLKGDDFANVLIESSEGFMAQPIQTVSRKTHTGCSATGSQGYSLRAVDQTPEESFKILQNNPKALGTCLFLVPAPENGILESKVIAVPGLKYVEASKRGQNCEAIKWIADEVMSPAEIEKMRPDCSIHFCGPPPHDWCPLGCMCGLGNWCVG